MKETSSIALRRVAVSMIGLAIALASFAAFQPEYIDPEGFLVEPFAYRAAAALLGLCGLVLMAIVALASLWSSFSPRN